MKVNIININTKFNSLLRKETVSALYTVCLPNRLQTPGSLQSFCVTPV